MSRIQWEQVTFRYPGSDRNAIDNVTLTVPSGAFCLLCGKSGCGKTTLLQQLKPAITPHGTRTGQVTLSGTPVDGLSFRDQSTRIGYVMQDPDSQLVTDQVWHELAFGLENLGLDQQTIRLRVAEMAQFFGLQELFHRDVHTLSGGQKQQVNLAGVMVMQPDVLVLDENNNLFRFDSELNKINSVSLVGEGWALGTSEDGRWIGVGTREGDTYILDADGVTHFSNRSEAKISQIYFGTDRCFVVTQSKDLYEFSVDRLDNIGAQSKLKSMSVWMIAGSAVALFASAVVAFPRSRRAGKRFFRAIHRHRTAYLMLAPSIVLILIFNYYNVFQAFYYAFTDWSLSTRTMREVNFVGFDNFVKMINEGYFLLGVKNLAILMIANFVKLLTVPVLLAELVFAMRTLDGKSSKRRYWFRLLLVVPMVVPGVVSTLMWKNIFDPNIGALNSFLDVIGRSEWKHSWLGDPKTALGSVIAMGFPWVNSFAFLVFYGGLINIPEDLFEAAKVDGSNPFWNFFHIHLPLISPQIKMLVITTFISSVQDYGGIYLLTAGGPGTATYVPGLELYYAATKFGQYGYACAMGLVMFVVILLGSLLNLRMKTQELN